MKEEESIKAYIAISDTLKSHFLSHVNYTMVFDTNPQDNDVGEGGSDMDCEEEEDAFGAMSGPSSSKNTRQSQANIDLLQMSLANFDHKASLSIKTSKKALEKARKEVEMKLKKKEEEEKMEAQKKLLEQQAEQRKKQEAEQRKRNQDLLLKAAEKSNKGRARSRSQGKRTARRSTEAATTSVTNIFGKLEQTVTDSSKIEDSVHESSNLDVESGEYERDLAGEVGPEDDEIVGSDDQNEKGLEAPSADMKARRRQVTGSRDRSGSGSRPRRGRSFSNDDSDNEEPNKRSDTTEDHRSRSFSSGRARRYRRQGSAGNNIVAACEDDPKSPQPRRRSASSSRPKNSDRRRRNESSAGSEHSSGFSQSSSGLSTAATDTSGLGSSGDSDVMSPRRRDASRSNSRGRRVKRRDPDGDDQTGDNKRSQSGSRAGRRRSKSRSREGSSPKIDSDGLEGSKSPRAGSSSRSSGMRRVKSSGHVSSSSRDPSKETSSSKSPRPPSKGLSRNSDSSREKEPDRSLSNSWHGPPGRSRNGPARRAMKKGGSARVDLVDPLDMTKVSHHSMGSGFQGAQTGYLNKSFNSFNEVESSEEEEEDEIGFVVSKSSRNFSLNKSPTAPKKSTGPQRSQSDPVPDSFSANMMNFADADDLDWGNFGTNTNESEGRGRSEKEREKRPSGRSSSKNNRSSSKSRGRRRD